LRLTEVEQAVAGACLSRTMPDVAGERAEFGLEDRRSLVRELSALIEAM
jgi:hypothetical protein